MDVQDGQAGDLSGRSRQPVWDYTQGTELRDPTGKELGDYYARLVSWYTKGGFTDEFGKRHESGHRRKIDYWEVLNEPDLEHSPTPEQYTARYDAIVSAIHKVSPETKFVGISLALPGGAPEFFEYFLESEESQAGHSPRHDLVSLLRRAGDGPTRRFSSSRSSSRPTSFSTPCVTSRRFGKRLSPATIDDDQRDRIESRPKISCSQPGPRDQFSRSAELLLESVRRRVRVLFTRARAQIGIDVAGESQLVGYPTQFPSVTMVDWSDGRPNARYWVLKLLHDNFGPGDTLIDSGSGPFAAPRTCTRRRS